MNDPGPSPEPQRSAAPYQGAPDRAAPGARSPARVVNTVRAVPFILAVLVFGVVALVTGHDKAGLPVILFTGLTGLLSLIAWLRRRRHRT